MRNTIATIFSGETSERVHDEFSKFSKGKFENRYLIEGKRQSKKWVVKTSAEFANYFVERCLPASGSIPVSGVIVSTGNLKDDCDFEIEKVKQFQGVKQIVIKTEVDAEKIRGLMEKYPKAFFALSFKNGENELKVKAKAPKSGKPSSKGDEGPKADFCSLKTPDESIINDLFFDFPEFKEIKVNHTLEITDIKIDTSIEDPREMREKAVRSGKVIRNVVVDGVEKVSEKDFSV